MLTLPPDCRDWCAGPIVARILRGINNINDRIECSALLILASLRLWMATTRSKETTSVKHIDTCCWGVGRLRYRFLPEMDDATFLAFLRRRRYVDRDFVIVPVEADLLFRLAAKAELGRRTPQIFSVDSFVTWRTMWAGLDAQRPRQEISAQLFSLYNECVQEKDRPELLIDKPNPIAAC